jgi:act minimal PKS ketosynthase (KS/KS alpha)
MRRAAITGVGVVSAGGFGREGFWDLITSGRTATGRISFFDASAYRSRVAAESEFTPEKAGISPDEAERMDRAAQFAVFCAKEALADSGLEASSPPPERMGVSIGSALGSITRMEEEYVVVSSSGQDHLVDHTAATPHLYSYFHPSQLAAEVAWVAGAEGPATVVSTGCTSGLDAVGYASELIRDGSADVMIAGATEAPITPISLACFDVIKATTNRNDTPETASRPFDASRNGFVLGEGAAVFVLEEAERARARGAHVYAEVGGYATRSNAYHMTGLKPDGREMAEAIRVALVQAGLEPTDVAYINAHGSGTKQNDRHETAAFKVTLGDHAYKVPVSSIKSMIGHSLGAIGSIEIAACALAIDRGVVPPTANLHDPDPECDLDYVPLVAREHVTDVALTVGSGFGGFQSAMVLARQGKLS